MPPKKKRKKWPWVLGAIAVLVIVIAAGCDVVTVQRAMGHKGATTTTLNTYSHLWPKAEDRTRAAVAKLLTEQLRVDSSDSGSDLD